MTALDRAWPRLTEPSPIVCALARRPHGTRAPGVQASWQSHPDEWGPGPERLTKTRRPLAPAPPFHVASDAVRNYSGLTPLVLAAQQGKMDMFQHIYNRRRRAFYTFGKVGRGFDPLIFNNLASVRGEGALAWGRVAARLRARAGASLAPQRTLSPRCPRAQAAPAAAPKLISDHELQPCAARDRHRSGRGGVRAQRPRGGAEEGEGPGARRSVSCTAEIIKWSNVRRRGRGHQVCA